MIKNRQIGLDDKVWVEDDNASSWWFAVDRKLIEEDDYSDPSKIQEMTLRELFDWHAEVREFEDWKESARNDIMSFDVSEELFRDLIDEYFYEEDPERDIREEHEWNVWRYTHYIVRGELD